MQGRRRELILLGLGNVGRELLRQILQTREAVKRRDGLRLVTTAVADISGALVELEGLPEGTLRRALAVTSSGGLLESLPDAHELDGVRAAIRPGAIVADLTASPETGPTLRAAVENKCGIVLANKHPVAGPWREAQSFYGSPHVRYEVTVGAGLPVISTLQVLVDTGDRITEIEGCLSGTLGYLCSELERGNPFSAAVEEARALGYAEPDPREDLRGRDVARKALIMARTAGWPLDSADLTVEPLYREELASVPIDAFLAASHAQDGLYRRRFAEALDRGETLRYVARVGPKGGSVGLVAVKRESSLGTLRGPGNYVAFWTERYAEIPLAIAGPGAGPQVTAAGVLGDIIRISRET